MIELDTAPGLGLRDGREERCEKQRTVGALVRVATDEQDHACPSSGCGAECPSRLLKVVACERSNSSPPGPLRKKLTEWSQHARFGAVKLTCGIGTIERTSSHNRWLSPTLPGTTR